ncbi:MAG: ATP-binding cassette domain-containing protein [Spirochaetaceae bacterium]|nr:ATP-binding cassette domain-containing protein [Spirochaetaceae bacterium]
MDKVSFSVYRGECVAAVGPNGSGKTTTLKLLLGLKKPDSGSIELFCAANQIGYVPQNIIVNRSLPLTVHDAVKMGRLKPLSRTFKAPDREAVWSALEQVKLSMLAAKPYNTLSGGQRRRILVARALAAMPDLLVLDEPTANMDSESEHNLFETLLRLKGRTTLFIVSHDTGFVSQLTDRIIHIERGNCYE